MVARAWAGSIVLNFVREKEASVRRQQDAKAASTPSLYREWPLWKELERCCRDEMHGRPAGPAQALHAHERSRLNNLSAPGIDENHDVDTLLGLDKSRTIRDDSYGFCTCHRFHFRHRPHLGIRIARLARPARTCELILRHLASSGPADSHLGIRPCPASLLGKVRLGRRDPGSH